MIKRESFYQNLTLIKNLTESKRQGINAIFDEWERRGLYDGRQLAYILATVYHETAHTMQPIEEYGKGKGHSYGDPYPGTGKIYYGRGLVQLTWYRNYMLMGERLGIDLVDHPELALQMDVSVKILFEGMIHGLFTGKKLEDYFKIELKADPINARKIINGLDKAELIAGYYQEFVNALFV